MPRLTADAQRHISCVRPRVGQPEILSAPPSARSAYPAKNLLCLKGCRINVGGVENLALGKPLHQHEALCEITHRIELVQDLRAPLDEVQTL